MQRKGKKISFTVVLDNGKKVDVTWDPGFMNHLEFRGPISETGYRSDFPFPYGDKISLEKVKEVARVRAQLFYKDNPAKHGLQKSLL